MRRILLTALCLAVLLVSSTAPTPARADLPVQELTLRPLGGANDVRAGSGGELWVSETSAGEIRRQDPGGGYSAYAVGGSPHDARPDGAGGAWWVDGTQLHRLDLTSRATQAWTVPGSSQLWGTGIDSQGRLWLSDAGAGSIFRFDPGTKQVCGYALPSAGGASNFLTVSGGQVWVGDANHGQLDRLDTATNQWTAWQLDPNPGSSPSDVAVDGGGKAWYTDWNASAVGSLDPATNSLTVYPMPGVQTPYKLALAGGKIWLTEPLDGLISLLDPAQATPGSKTVNPTTSSAAVSCGTAAQTGSGTTGITTGTAAPANASYPVDPSSGGGYTVYQMPSGSQPWGIAFTGSTWVVDWARNVLVHVPAAGGGSLVLAKTLSGGPAGYASPFTIQYNCGAGTSGSVQVSAGGSQSVSGIPGGTSCTVSESLPAAPGGYLFAAPAYSPSAVVQIPAANGSSVTVTVTNTLVPFIPGDHYLYLPFVNR